MELKLVKLQNDLDCGGIGTAIELESLTVVNVSEPTGLQAIAKDMVVLATEPTSPTGYWTLVAGLNGTSYVAKTISSIEAEISGLVDLYVNGAQFTQVNAYNPFVPIPNGVWVRAVLACNGWILTHPYTSWTGSAFEDACAGEYVNVAVTPETTFSAKLITGRVKNGDEVTIVWDGEAQEWVVIEAVAGNTLWSDEAGGAILENNYSPIAESQEPFPATYISVIEENGFKLWSPTGGGTSACEDDGQSVVISLVGVDADSMIYQPSTNDVLRGPLLANQTTPAYWSQFPRLGSGLLLGTQSTTGGILTLTNQLGSIDFSFKPPSDGDTQVFVCPDQLPDQTELDATEWAPREQFLTARSMFGASVYTNWGPIGFTFDGELWAFSHDGTGYPDKLVSFKVDRGVIREINPIDPPNTPDPLLSCGFIHFDETSGEPDGAWDVLIKSGYIWNYDFVPPAMPRDIFIWESDGTRSQVKYDDTSGLVLPPVTTQSGFFSGTTNMLLDRTQAVRVRFQEGIAWEDQGAVSGVAESYVCWDASASQTKLIQFHSGTGIMTGSAAGPTLPSGVLAAVDAQTNSFCDYLFTSGLLSAISCPSSMTAWWVVGAISGNQLTASYWGPPGTSSPGSVGFSNFFNFAYEDGTKGFAINTIGGWILVQVSCPQA